MPAPTAQEIGVRLLRDIGVTSLDATSPANQPTPIEDGDTDDVAGVMTAAFQEMWEHMPAEGKQAEGGGWLNAPADVTVTVTLGSKTISALTTYAAWMLGCTIRIAGDDQDNALVSSTQLARPHAGTSGSKTATVFGDCILLDETIEHVISPLFLSNFGPLTMANSREEFMRLGQWPLGSFGSHYGNAWPYYLFTRKAVAAHPMSWIVEGAYDSSLDYLPRRIRFSPMPSAALSVGWISAMNPPRITAAMLATDSMVVTGTLSPDASGTYTRQGSYNGYPLYILEGTSDYFLFYHIGGTSLGYIIASVISAAAPATRFVPATAQTVAAGTYAAVSPSTGTATVKASTSATAVKLPIPNGRVESIYMGICRQRMTGLPQFKNEDAKPEIARQYKAAMDNLQNIRGGSGEMFAAYPR